MLLSIRSSFLMDNHNSSALHGPCCVRVKCSFWMRLLAGTFWVDASHTQSKRETLKLKRSLDDDTSAIVEDVVRTCFEDWTVIAIAHKVDSILDFDLVAVLDAGQIIELDDPKVLLTRKSVFQELYSRTGASDKVLRRQATLAQRRQ